MCSANWPRNCRFKTFKTNHFLKVLDYKFSLFLLSSNIFMFSTRKKLCVKFFDGFTTFHKALYSSLAFRTFGGSFEAIFYEEKSGASIFCLIYYLLEFW